MFPQHARGPVVATHRHWAVCTWPESALQCITGQAGGGGVRACVCAQQAVLKAQLQ